MDQTMFPLPFLVCFYIIQFDFIVYLYLNFIKLLFIIAGSYRAVNRSICSVGMNTKGSIKFDGFMNDLKIFNKTN